MGPITIFDKSALQSLSMDESVWLDAFFLVNVVPVFYVETLADLEKEVAEGKAPEDLVGMLAAKMPTNANPNAHHSSLISGELTGWKVPMDGQIPIAGGKTMRDPEGRIGVHVEEFAEVTALNRWKDHEFLEIEREIARLWRAELSEHGNRLLSVPRNVLPAEARISDLAALKVAIDEFCDTADKEVIRLALNVLGVPDHSARGVLARWERAGRPKLEAFAPYTTHVFKVDLLLDLGIDRGFISGVRRSNWADMAYLYYLPFCMVFTSGDNLHRRTAPLFMRPNQSFVEASALKAALKELDIYYEHFPNEMKVLGVMVFAHNPPPHLDNLVVELWDKHMPRDWRKSAESPDQVLARWRALQEEGGAAEFRACVEAAEPVGDRAAQREDGGPDHFLIKRQVPVRKGSGAFSLRGSRRSRKTTAPRSATPRYPPSRRGMRTTAEARVRPGTKRVRQLGHERAHASTT